MSEGTKDQADVLEVVGRYFADPEAQNEGLLAGKLLEWVAAMGEVPWHERYRFDRTLEGATVRELSHDAAVVDIKARFEARLKRGSVEYVRRADGPVRLERLDGEWRIVDLVVEGRGRCDSIVLGTLAEQHQVGVTARVVGLDRHASGTSFLIELSDVGAGDVRLVNAYALVEHDTLWSKLSVASREALPPGGTRRILVQSEHEISLDETTMAVALDVRSGARRLPFVMTVPPRPPGSLVPQPAPRRLPPLRGSWPRHLLIYAGITAAVGWWYGWIAILVPLYVALSFYWQVRVKGILPPHLYRYRSLLDLAVVAAVFSLLWLTPITDLAVPFLVATATFALLTPMGPRRHQARMIASLTAGVAWFFLLGTATGPLSPCRLTAGSPASFSDSFARALLTGDDAFVDRHSSSGLPKQLSRSLKREYVSTRADAVVGTRRPVDPHDGFCEDQRDRLGAVGCYEYKVTGARAGQGELNDLVVAVRCDARTWRVSEWF